MTEPTSSPTVDAWCTWMRAQSWSERTVADRSYLIARAGLRQGCAPEDLTTGQVLAFLSTAGIAATSRQTYHAAFRSWFSWLVSTGLRADDPMEGVPKPRAGRRTAKHITTEHLEHLLASRMHARTRTMILLAAYQGLRVHEVAKIRGADVDLVAHELFVVGKGDVHSVLPLHPVVEEQAARYGSGWWFPQWTANQDGVKGGHILGASVGRIVGDAMRRAGVPGTAHSLRHWHATELLRSGVDSRVTQELMRHASLATTERYMHVDDSQRREGLLKLPDVTGARAATALPSPEVAVHTHVQEPRPISPAALVESLREQGWVETTEASEVTGRSIMELVMLEDAGTIERRQISLGDEDEMPRVAHLVHLPSVEQAERRRPLHLVKA